MNRLAALLLTALLLLLSSGSQAVDEKMLMTRIQQDFPEAMSLLQKTITEHGYTVSRIQHVDVGLTASGFKTDRYRIVFFGKDEEVRNLSRQYPALIPYLPLMMTIFSEGDETLVVASDPMILQAVSEDETLKQYLLRWQTDMGSIMSTLRVN